MAIGYKEQSAASVPTPPSGQQYTFIDTADGKVKRKDSTGTVTIVETAGGASASSISVTPVGDITSTDVQAAIQELDTEKLTVAHKGAGGVSEHPVVTGSTAGFMSPSDFTKLAGVASGATANDTDANLKNRANHTGTQAAGTITGLAAVATSGSKSDVGLGNVDNTSDVNKPVSTAQAAADTAAIATAEAYSVQRSNHTGTQIASTISDFDTAADARITAQKGAASGLATLDGSSKVPLSQIPASLIGGLNYQGTWDASTNSPSLASGVGTKGYYYKVNAAGSTGLDGITDWKINDVAVYNGATWDKIDNTDQVTSVAGKQGTVLLDTGDVSEAANLYFTNSRAKTAVVLNTLAGSETDQAPSVLATKNSIATKATDPTTTDGDLIYRSSGALTRLPIGTEDYLLRSVGGFPVWQEENLTQDFGDGSDGNLTVSGALTLSQIPYYNVLTIAAGAVLNTGGYPIYCKVLDLTNAPAGSIVRNGNAGTTVAANTGGAGGAALTAQVLGAGGAGGTGAAGATNAGVQGGAGGAINPGNGGSGGNSGASGAGGTGAAAAAAAGATVSSNVHYGRFEYQFLRGAALVGGGAGGRGGNSGGGDGANSSRGGGGGGGGAGVITIYAAEIITGGSTPSGVIQAKGGAGATNSNAPAAGNVGGSGGGGGGGGGYVYITYVKKTGASVTSLIDASGGSGGNGSAGLGTGIGGNGGVGGNGGIIQTYDVTNGTGVQTIGSAGASGTAGSGVTAGVGGNGGNCVFSL